MLGCKIVAPIWLPLLGSNQRQPVLTHLPRYARRNGEFVLRRDRIASNGVACDRQTSRQPRFALLDVARDWHCSCPRKKVNKKAARLVANCFFVGSPCWARTSDNLINSQVLIPTELRRNIELGIRKYPYVSAMTYLPRPSPAKYCQHCRA